MAGDQDGDDAETRAAGGDTNADMVTSGRASPRAAGGLAVARIPAAVVPANRCSATPWASESPGQAGRRHGLLIRGLGKGLQTALRHPPAVLVIYMRQEGARLEDDVQVDLGPRGTQGMIWYLL